VCFCRLTCVGAFIGIPDADCRPSALGFGPPGTGHSPADALALCGVALLRGVVPAETLLVALKSFLALPSKTLEALSHGRIREERAQAVVPFSPPFDNLQLLGAKGELLSPLLKVLGDAFVLDLMTVVSVPPGAGAQDPHRDTPLDGSISVHIPMQAISTASAPLGMCAGTCNTTNEYSMAVFREAMLWRPKSESSQDAKRRLFCGGRQRTDVLNLEVSADKIMDLKLRSGRLGARIAGFRSKTSSSLAWKVNDEITHVNGKKVRDEDEVFEVLEALNSDTAAAPAAAAVHIRYERPWEGPLPHPERLTVGAPLEIGDALLYDSRTWHWGMPNTGDTTRYVLYVVFKSNETHAGIHPEAGSTAEVSEARRAFQKKFWQLREAFGAAPKLNTLEL